MKEDLQYTYYVAKGGTVDHPDKDFGKGVFAAAFAIEFLYEAYSDPQFASVQSAILAQIVNLADWVLTQQCTDPAKKAYGGFKGVLRGFTEEELPMHACMRLVLWARTVVKT